MFKKILLGFFVWLFKDSIVLFTVENLEGIVVKDIQILKGLFSKFW